MDAAQDEKERLLDIKRKLNVEVVKLLEEDANKVKTDHQDFESSVMNDSLLYKTKEQIKNIEESENLLNRYIRFFRYRQKLLEYQSLTKTTLSKRIESFFDRFAL